MSYRALAQVYDKLTADVNYSRRARFIHRRFKDCGVRGIVLDAGCGTGTLTLYLAGLGYDMIGVDASEEMLSIAASKTANKRFDVAWLQQSLEELDLFGTVGGIVCMQDTLNHLGSRLSRVLDRFSMFLEPGGVLIFDINTPYKQTQILGDNDFIYPVDGGLCIWRNRYNRWLGRVRLTVDLFLEDENGRYTRETDEFFEYTIEPDRLEHLLAARGFVALEKLDGDTYRPVHAQSQRILYIMRKK